MTIDGAVLQDFVRCARESLHTCTGCDAVVVAADRDDGGGVTISIDLHGELEGPVTWRFPASLAIEFVRRLLAPEDPPAECTQDGASELANILTGSATDVLERAGWRCELGVPRVEEGVLPDGDRVGLATESGMITLVVSLRRPHS